MKLRSGLLVLAVLGVLLVLAPSAQAQVRPVRVTEPWPCLDAGFYDPLRACACPHGYIFDPTVGFCVPVIMMGGYGNVAYLPQVLYECDGVLQRFPCRPIRWRLNCSRQPYGIERGEPGGRRGKGLRILEERLEQQRRLPMARVERGAKQPRWLTTILPQSSRADQQAWSSGGWSGQGGARSQGGGYAGGRGGSHSSGGSRGGSAGSHSGGNSGSRGGHSGSGGGGGGAAPHRPR